MQESQGIFNYLSNFQSGNEELIDLDQFQIPINDRLMDRPNHEYGCECAACITHYKEMHYPLSSKKRKKQRVKTRKQSTMEVNK